MNTWSEEYRHQCEVREVIRWRMHDRNKAMDHINLVRKRRGEEAANKLENDCRVQWSKGNRGEKGDWK